MAFTGMARVSHQILPKALRRHPALSQCANKMTVECAPAWVEFVAGAMTWNSHSQLGKVSWEGSGIPTADLGKVVIGASQLLKIPSAFPSPWAGWEWETSLLRRLYKMGLSRRAVPTAVLAGHVTSVGLVLSWARCYRFLSERVTSRRCCNNVP